MKKLSLLLFVALTFACCSSDSAYVAMENAEQLIDLTDKINSLKRENKGLNEDIAKNKGALIELMKLSTEANDDLAKSILVERISELMKVGDAKALKLRENNNSISHFSDKIRQITTNMEYAQRVKSDTARNILSVDSVQQGN